MVTKMLFKDSDFAPLHKHSVERRIALDCSA